MGLLRRIAPLIVAGTLAAAVAIPAIAQEDWVEQAKETFPDYVRPAPNIEFRFGAGIGYETGSVAGNPPASSDWGATTTDPGNTPLLDTMPQIYAEFINRDSGFGADVLFSWAMTESPNYVKAYQPFYETYSGNTQGDPGVSADNPEYFFTADLTYHLPRIGPLDLEVFAGDTIWTGSGNSNADLPISAGSDFQAGAAVTLKFLDNFFVQARGSWRFYSSESAAVGGGGTPVPLGTYDIAILGGYATK